MANSDDSRMCRLCMKSEDVILVDIFYEDVNTNNEAAQVPLPLKIMACLDIEVDLDDRISHYACHRCAKKVDSFYEFKERSKQVDVILREKMRKEFQNVHFQEEISCDNASEEMQTQDEPAVLLVPINGSSKQDDDLKDPLALSDTESNTIQTFERKTVRLVQRKKSPVKIDDVIRQQRENFNRIQERRKKRPEFLNLENTIKQQRETFKSKDLKDNKSPEIVNEPVQAKNEPDEVSKQPFKSQRKTYCRHCHRSFPSEQFSKHLLVHQKKRALPVSHQKKSQLQKFKKVTQNGKKMYCCLLCNQIFIMKYSLQRHLLMHQANENLNSRKLHQCPVCSKCYTVSSSLKRHLILHTGERPFRCPICPRSFSDRSNLIKHERIHYPAKPFCCTLCPAKFQFKNYLRKHLTQHLDDTQMYYTPDHDCYTKKMRPDEQLAMMMSKNKAWLGKQLLSFTADTSSDEDVSDTDNDIEIITESADDAVPSTSQQEQTRPEDDQNEMESNSVSSWFRCRNCQTICPTYRQLIDHRKIHSGVSGFRCTLCKSLYQSQSALTRHITTSHFKCNICDKIFMTKLICQRHEMGHKPEKSNACSICDRIFLSIDALSKHMMKHNLQAPFKCALCNSEFTSRTVLEMHIKVCCRQMKQVASDKQ